MLLGCLVITAARASETHSPSTVLMASMSCEAGFYKSQIKDALRCTIGFGLDLSKNTYRKIM